jgi:hypothetical protein
LKELQKMKGNNWVTIADFEFFKEKKKYFWIKIYGLYLLMEQIVSVGTNSWCQPCTPGWTAVPLTPVSEDSGVNDIALPRTDLLRLFFNILSY